MFADQPRTEFNPPITQISRILRGNAAGLFTFEAACLVCSRARQDTLDRRRGGSRACGVAGPKMRVFKELQERALIFGSRVPARRRPLRGRPPVEHVSCPLCNLWIKLTPAREELDAHGMTTTVRIVIRPTNRMHPRWAHCNAPLLETQRNTHNEIGAGRRMQITHVELDHEVRRGGGVRLETDRKRELAALGNDPCALTHA